jgi:hypothetical protein
MLTALHQQTTHLSLTADLAAGTGGCALKYKSSGMI